MGKNTKNINGYVPSEAFVSAINMAAKIEGVKPSRWVGDACVIRLTSENRLPDSPKSRLQAMVCEALDGGVDERKIESAIQTVLREEVV